MTQNNTLPVCPRCHQTAQMADAAFCPFCGAPMQQAQPDMPQELKQLLKKIDEQADPVKKHKLLTEAQEKYPDSLEVAEELLFLGRLHERSNRNVDFSIIKCHVWHMYLTPSDFSEEKKDAMRQELLAHPQLLRCLELAPDKDRYMRRYLERLAGEFVNLFLKGSSHYSRSIFGLRLDTRMDRVLADPAAHMLRCIYQDDQLTPQQRDMMYDAFYRAFLAEAGGKSTWVDELLEKLDCPIPVKL